MSIAILAAQFVVAYLAGTLLHEATHYGFAWLFGMNPKLRLTKSYLFWRIHVNHDGYEHFAISDLLIHLSPFYIGLLAAGWWVVQTPFYVELWMVVGWFSYTLLGLPNDLRFQVADDETTV